MLYLYVARRFLAPFGTLLGILLFTLALERVLRLVQVVTEHGAPVYKVGTLIFYLLPHYFGLAIPSAFFMAVMLGLRGLQQNSELAIVRASGLPVRRLLIPILAVATVLGAVMLLLTGYLQPHARHAYRTVLHEIRTKDFWANLKPGVFQQIEEHRVLRADGVLDHGRHLLGFFASYEQPDQTRVYVTAREAVILDADGSGGDDALELRDGMVLFRNLRPGAKEPVLQLSFDRYPWRLSESDLIPAHGPRGQDEREMRFGELLTGGVPGTKNTTTEAKRLTELHLRLVKSVSVPLFGLLAVPLALLGGGRAGRPFGFVIGIVIFVFYQQLLGMGDAFAKGAIYAPWVAPWATFAALVLAAVTLFYEYSGDKDRPPAPARTRRPVPARA